MIRPTLYRRFLENACEHYEKLAPTVEAHCNDLFIRISEHPERVTLAELLAVQQLQISENGRHEWLQANYAANAIYKLRQRLGMDTTGEAGF